MIYGSSVLYQKSPIVSANAYVKSGILYFTMKTTTLVIAAVMIATIAAVAIAPSLTNLASAAQTSTCTNGGGISSTGPCTGNTDSNHKTCSAKNNGQTNKLC